MTPKTANANTPRGKLRAKSVIHPVIELNCKDWAPKGAKVTKGRFRFLSNPRPPVVVDCSDWQFVPTKACTLPFELDPADAKVCVDSLTPRERQVAQLIAMGVTEKKIAQKLGISSKALEGFLGKVRAKLGVTTHGIPRVWFCAAFSA